MFLPHDEFETAKEYEDRISRQVLLMKDIVLLSSKKMDIKKAEKLQLIKQKEQERKAKIESLLAESMTTVELKADAIGRYNIEQETFPIVVKNQQNQNPRANEQGFRQVYLRRGVRCYLVNILKKKLKVLLKMPCPLKTT